MLSKIIASKKENNREGKSKTYEMIWIATPTARNDGYKKLQNQIVFLEAFEERMFINSNKKLCGYVQTMATK